MASSHVTRYLEENPKIGLIYAHIQYVEENDITHLCELVCDCKPDVSIGLLRCSAAKVLCARVWERDIRTCE